MQFFVLKIGMFGQYKFAWYETPKATYSDDCFRCPKCGRPVSLLRWQPPYEVVLKQPRRVGDFVRGAGGCDFLTSVHFLTLCEEEQFSGIEEVLPIIVTRMGTTKAANSLERPRLFGLNLVHSLTQLKYEEMGIVWGSPPKPDYCRLCGPGGGGIGGWWKRRERVVVDEATWSGHDIFFAINGPGTILLSERAANAIIQHGLTNATVTPCEEAAFDFLA